MKLCVLSITATASITMALSIRPVTSDMSLPAEIPFQRSSVHAAKLLHNAIKIQRRGDEASSSKRVLPQISSSDPKKQRGQSPPDSPRTAAMKVESAEKKASEARAQFKQAGESYLRGMGNFANRPPNPNPETAHRDRMALLSEYRAAANAKQAQARAYKNAAELAGKAHRLDRQSRNNQKAAAAEVTSRFHNANIDTLYHNSLSGLRRVRYQDAAMRFGDSDLRTMEAKDIAHQTMIAENRSERTTQALFEESRRLRKHEGGKDTDSSSSDLESRSIA